jgi:hypothetical protein
MKETTNNDRARWANAAMSAFANETGMTGEDQETIMGDLLCNLMHLADAESIDFDARLENGRLHYTAETEGDDFTVFGPQPKADADYAV